MKQSVITIVLSLCALVGVQTEAYAQFGNLLNRAKQEANKAVNSPKTKNAAKKAVQKARKSSAKETTFEYGEHVYTQKGTFKASRYDKYAAGEVTFTNIPSDFEEFEAVYTQFLGLTPHGTAAMIPMAMELYARDREVGKKCIELLCYETNINSFISRLRDKFGAEPSDSYGERYLPAALLKGAKAQNAYTPDQPYTVEMEASVNPHQELQITGSGTVMYLYIIGSGWDAQQRQVEIHLEDGEELHKVFNCPSVYSGCKQIRGNWQGLE